MLKLKRRPDKNPPAKKTAASLTDPAAVAKPATVKPDTDRRGREFRRSVSDFMTSRHTKRITLICVCLFIGALYPMWQIRDLKQQNSALQSRVDAQVEGLNKRVDQYGNSCASTDSCKTFPFILASEAAQRYASACFFYDSANTDDQITRLKLASGPANCGWQRVGSGTTATVSADSAVQQSIPDGKGGTRADIGVVGVKVQMAGQPDYLNYIVPVKTVGGGVQIAWAGAFYTSPPTTQIVGCTQDSNPNGNASTEIAARIQSMEAGRVNTPNIDPNDYLKPGLTIARFGPSITKVTVEGVAVCRGGDETHLSIQTREVITGPTPGAQFAFDYGYTVERIDASGKWFVTGWGPMIDSSVQTF